MANEVISSLVVTLRVTVPDSVNLIAFESRLTRICRSLCASPMTHFGRLPGGEKRKGIPFSVARSATRAKASSVTARGLIGFGVMLSLPASTLEKSRMSSITPCRCLPALRMRAQVSPVRRPAFSRRPIRASPMTPLSGVRISWLMLARKALLAMAAASAACLASRNSCSTRFRSVMSCMKPISLWGEPAVAGR